MAICSDPMVEALKDRGYNVLAIPREDFAPLQLLRSDGRKTLRPVGSLALELASDTPLPVVYTGERLPDLTVTRSRQLRGKLGFEVLGGLLQAMGGTPTVATELSREDGATIVLTGVTRDSVAEGDLAAYFEHDIRARTERTRQLAENGQLFVVIAVLASRVLHVETSKKVAARVEASIPITAGVAPKIEPSGGSTGTVTLAWDGETALPFGFQAVQVVYRDGRWSNFTDAVGRIAYATEPDANTVRRLLILDDDLVEVDVETQSQ